MHKAAGGFILMTVFLSCRSPGAGNDESRPKVATVVSLGGAVQVLRGGTVDWIRIDKGAPLFDDDRLRTFRAAFAQLSFPNGSALRVDEESLISLGAISLGGGIIVERGTVEGELQPGLRLRTPGVEAETASRRDVVIQ